MENFKYDINYLKLLSKTYPSISKSTTEIINLNAILHLPKGTEHFLSDIHGEHDAFIHFLSSGSGVIRYKIGEVLENVSSERKDFFFFFHFWIKFLCQNSNNNNKKCVPLWIKKKITNYIELLLSYFRLNKKKTSTLTAFIEQF